MKKQKGFVQIFPLLVIIILLIGLILFANKIKSNFPLKLNSSPSTSPSPTPSVSPSPKPSPVILKSPTPTPSPKLSPVPTTQANNVPPGAGYSHQNVTTDAGTFSVDIIAADISSTRVVVDTASSGDCGNNCPVLALSDYVGRTGAYAGVNGSYFCPTSYPACAGKTNSFDTLLMNLNKVYFNSANNTYSTVPAVIFGNGYIRFVMASSEWGRDTSIDSMIANQPMLVFNHSITFGGDSDPKKSSLSTRGFVANKGNTVYIGMVHSVSVAESAKVMQVLGMDNALNLDDGGSAALWFGGYKVGPGRQIPNAILFTHR